RTSLVFVKRMMAVAVSTITYLRGIFPEDAYRSRYLEGEHVWTPIAHKFRDILLMGCFEALEKQYVSRLQPVIIISKEHLFFLVLQCITESYQFKFRYTEKGPEIDILRNRSMEMQVTLEDTKRASVLLIRKLFLLMQNLDALPSNVYMTMKLYYYDDITPADYQPPGFKEGECDNLWFEGIPVHFRVGEVQTAFHNLRVRVSADQGRVEKLQNGNHLREAKQVPERISPEKEVTRVEDDLPSEDGKSVCSYISENVKLTMGAYTDDFL
uniref:Zebrafish testis-expressed 38 n=1 Tax=Stegastes partitus TaxID=144197 RepID=A0A3B4Z8P2_9TELE